MQDRTSANSMKVLLQRTAGPYIGSIADMTRHLADVCFTPESGHRPTRRACPLSANRVLTRRSKSAAIRSPRRRWRWPGATIILRQGARVVHDSRRPRVVKR